MFDTINGLPVHVLVVHAVVVLLPLAALGAVALAVRPVWRRTYGRLVLAVTLVATIAVPVATRSGEALERRVGDPGEHARLGGWLIYFAVPLLILVAAMVLLDRRSHQTSWTPPLIALSVAVVLLAGFSVFQVYRIGDSGARVAWEGKIAATNP